MSAIQPQAFPAPFDAIADHYDEVFTTSKIGQAQRSSVWKELEKTFHCGDRVLEVGCGTGVDACFLAERGIEVVACDSSAQMITVATRRVRESGREGLVRPRVLSAESIASLGSGESFDGVFSNFGALNCVPDLRQFVAALARLVRPGSTALLCWMGPFCLWETIWYLGQARPGKAFRRWHRGGVRARLADGAFVRVYYPSVRSLARVFAPEFRLQSFKGIGVTVPPSYLEHWVRRVPRLLQLAETFDSYLGQFPGTRALADHILLRFQRADPGA